MLHSSSLNMLVIFSGHRFTIRRGYGSHLNVLPSYVRSLVLTASNIVTDVPRASCRRPGTAGGRKYSVHVSLRSVASP